MTFVRKRHYLYHQVNNLTTKNIPKYEGIPTVI